MKFTDLVSIIIFAHSDMDCFGNCLCRILDCSAQENYELIVVEDEENVRMREYLSCLPGIKVLPYAENMRAGERWQRAAETSCGELLVFIQDTAIVTEGWLAVLKNEMREKTQAGIVQPFIYNNKADWEGEGMVASYLAFAVRRQAWEGVSGFCELYNTDLGVVIDLAVRMLKNGWKIWNTLACCMAFFCEPVNKYTSAQVKEDDDIFAAQHGYRAAYSSNKRIEMMNMIDFRKPGIRVLDIGCAAGANLMTIKNANPSAELYGIELSEGSAAIAKNFGNVIVGNFEKLERDDFEGSFDYILMGDVLEHLVDTEAALQKVHSWLKKGGMLVVSVPNIAHISIIFNLLQGRWDYQDAGILDRTHMRFFTEETIGRQLLENGFKIVHTHRIVQTSSLETYPLVGKLYQTLLNMEGMSVTEERLKTFQIVLAAEKV